MFFRRFFNRKNVKNFKKIIDKMPKDFLSINDESVLFNSLNEIQKFLINEKDFNTPGIFNNKDKNIIINKLDLTIQGYKNYKIEYNKYLQEFIKEKGENLSQPTLGLIENFIVLDFDNTLKALNVCHSLLNLIKLS